MEPIDPSDITPEHAYLTRRKFLKRTGMVALGALAFGGCKRKGGAATSSEFTPPTAPAIALPGRVPAIPALHDPSHRDELGNPVTMIHRVQTYGHYWEFTPKRMELGQAVAGYRPPPLSIQVGGLVARPGRFGPAELERFGQEERIYRLRCIECWAMVIPWLGLPLRRLLEAVEPLPEARYVRFESVYDPDQMPQQRPEAFKPSPEANDMVGGRVIGPEVWPYVEGLRLDEAMHELTFLATGMYGKPLPAVNGAPARIVVPWKYAYKSIKAVVKIELVAEQPATLWTTVSPEEYGFYGNVNPHVPHPRWEQTREVRYRGACPEPIVPTLMFNGYEEEVAHLYEGMDLSIHY